MTIITCEHCGPTRVAPHDINCPKYDGLRQVRAGETIGQPGRTGWPAPSAAMAAWPVAYVATHQTVAGLEGTPECVCGYDPRRKHPEATPGQLFAYVGQHIREQR